MDVHTRAAGAKRPELFRHAFPYARTVAQLVLAAALLAGLLWRTDIGQVRDELEGANLLWLPAAFIANLVSDGFRSVRWHYFLAPVKRVSLPFLFAVAVLGRACNFALPLRAGEVIRVQLMRRRKGFNASSVVATLLSEKIMDIMAFSSFTIIGLLLYQQARFLWPLALVYGLVVVAGVILMHRLASRSAQRTPLISQPEGRLRTWIATELHSFGEGLQVFRQWKAMLNLVWSSHAAWLFEGVMYYACGQALGLDLPLAVYLLMVVMATIAVSVPATVAGLGVFEVAVSGLLVAFGLNGAQAAAFAIFSHAMLVVPYFATGPLMAAGLRLSLSDVLFLRSANEEPEGAGA